MKEQKEEKKDAGDALEQVKPVASVAVAENVRFRLCRYQNPVNRMIKQRDEYAENLDKDQVGDVVNVLDVVVENLRPAHRGRICVHVNQEKDPERNDSGQLMKFT